ncbi:MAG: hypothetical protein AMJ64_04960 [Betaproteobacteria bacterium SG8_39]|nr:MAG: hypothetical protein AMJ64_04960 [Betaproteobacteria bacterium SG8_39]
MNTSINFDLEQRIVLACTLAPDAAGSGPFVDLGPADSIDWVRLRAVAAAFGVRPLVARGLAGSAPDELDACISAARANEGRARLLTGELLTILDALAAVGVPAIPFKGPVLEHVLGAAPGLREMGDLDFLVRTEHLFPATRALAPLGYQSVLPIHALDYPSMDRVSPEWPLLRPVDGLLIELHCRVAPAWFPTPCSLHDIEARQQTLTLAGHRIAWPAPEELLLIHICDGMKSCGRGMKWIGDVARILRRHPEMDWAHIKAVASRHGGLNVVRVALALVIDCCAETAEALDVPEIGLSVPPQAEARLTPRLAGAVEQIRAALQTDAPLPGAMAHFRWSIRVSDDRLKTARAIVRYLAGPAIADLAQEPSTAGILPLPARAFLRRLRSVVGVRH